MFLRWLIRTFTLCLCAWHVVFLSGCGLLELKNELVELKATFGLNGKIYNLSCEGVPTVAILYKAESDRIEIFDYSIPDPTGHYSFLVPEGVYYISAYEDLNRDFTYKEGERYGYANQSKSIQVVASGKGVQIHDIYLEHTSGYRRDLPAVIDISTLSGKSWIKVGVITDLEDPLFVQENGYQGYWKPFTFMRDIGIGIYFLEPYDPDKIPLLFVHGANGTPIGFKPILEELDRSRYQAWFYYYPSGLRLDAMAYALNELVKSLQEDLDFREMVVAAHSMGGLVSRAFIRKNAIEDRETYVRKLIALSTPWGGVKTAQMGVENSPVVVPNWYDVSPDSDFIKYIYEKPLPDHVEFYLLFGVRGNCSMMMANNDGIIEIASEIDYRAQNDAVQAFPFDEDHDSIIASKRVIERFHQLLE